MKQLALALALLVSCVRPQHVQTAQASPPLAADAGDPDYVTGFGVVVFDHAHRFSPAEVDAWTIATLTEANDDDRMRLMAILEGMQLVIYPGTFIDSPDTYCGVPPEGKRLLGCADVIARRVSIASETCAQPFPSPGIFAHELGHMILYIGHDFPWHTTENMEKKVTGSVCHICK